MPERFGKAKTGLGVFSAGVGQREGARKERFGRSGSLMAPFVTGG